MKINQAERHNDKYIHGRVVMKLISCADLCYVDKFLMARS